MAEKIKISVRAQPCNCFTAKGHDERPSHKKYDELYKEGQVGGEANKNKKQKQHWNLLAHFLSLVLGTSFPNDNSSTSKPSISG